MAADPHHGFFKTLELIVQHAVLVIGVLYERGLAVLKTNRWAPLLPFPVGILIFDSCRTVTLPSIKTLEVTC